MFAVYRYLYGFKTAFMKFRIYSLFLLVCLVNEASALRVIFDHRVFHVPGEGPYVEFITSFDAQTFDHISADSGMVQAHAELELILSRMGTIVDFRKVKVDGPQVKPEATTDFLSVERFMLPNGVYDLEVVVRDVAGNNPTEETLHQKIEINNPSTGVFVSDIEFVSAYRQTLESNAFSKSGYDLVPYVSNYFSSLLNSIIFYAEIYQTDQAFGQGNGFLSTVCVLDAMEKEVESCKRMKREKSTAVVPMLQVLDISDLPTGEYKVRVEVRNRENQLVYMKERAFSRNKVNEVAAAENNFQAGQAEVSASFASRFNHRDSLYSLILWHIPIAGDNEKHTIDNQLETADVQAMQSFLYNFWYKRNSSNPESSFNAYQENCKIVKENFETRIKPGWQTERGRVYLQYGKPNTRIVRPHDPDYWPFEIWHYYETDNNLHNRRFLFYDTTLMGDMELLHSDVPAEPKNFNWKEMVRSRPTALNMSDASMNNANQRVDTNSRDEIDNLWFTPH
jgi:GWxTD domain-containing protein